MSVIINPIEQYFDTDGSPLANGYLYFGVPFGNPTTEPVNVYYDPEFTIPAAQPVRTVNGYPVRAGTATGLFASDDVSILVQNSRKEQVIYIESSSISAIQTTTFYRDSDVLLTADDNNKTFIATLPFTQTFDASVVLGSSWTIQYVNMSNGLITFDPNLSETIDGQTTRVLQPNQSCYIHCDGVNLKTTAAPYPVQSVASALALDLTATKSKIVSITGATSPTSIVMVNGDVITAVFPAGITLTASASLVLSSGEATHITQASEVIVFSATSTVVYAKVNQIITDKIQPITASVGSNALTVTVNPTSMDFRSATLSSGTVNTRILSSASSLVVPSGATLGSTSAVQTRLAVLLIDNLGTLEVAVINPLNGYSLDETGLITTVALSTGSDSAGVFYSTTSRANVPYRLAGYIEYTQATSGTYATSPSLIQGAGGESLSKVTFNAFGDPPLFASRAWVNFNGTGTVAIRASGNVSSITDNGTGDYTVNFTTAMPDANYSALCSCQALDSNSYFTNISELSAPSTTSVRFKTESQTSTNTDLSFVCVNIFR